jgi:hypothetical protein
LRVPFESNKKPPGPEAQEVKASVECARRYVRRRVLKIDTADHSTGQVPDRQGDGVPFAPMVRRSFRIGLRLGLLFGVAFALVKTVQSRRTAAAVPPPAPWEPIVDTPRPAAPAREAEPVPVPEVPVPTAVDEPLVDEVGEPIMEPAPAVDHDPALDIVPEPPAEVSAPVKKVAAKKLPAAKKAAAPRKAAAKKATKAEVPTAAFVDPEGGVCPTSHPVKAKLASRLFHLPGMFAYDRTRADRCYRDADAAVADGFVQAKR